MTDFDSINEEISLTPQEEYYPKMKKAMLALPELDDTPHDLVEMLFSEDQMKWLKDNIRKE